MPRQLPYEVLVQVFDDETALPRKQFELRGCRGDLGRNEFLVCCALVCRGWTRAATHILYRDITLGVVVRTDALGRSCGDTAGALHALILELRAHPDVARHVRALHLGFGRYGVPLDERNISSLCHTSDFGVIARAVSLCPRLQTLSLEIGSRPLSQEPWFEAGDIARFSYKDVALMQRKVKRLEELRISSVRQLRPDAFQEVYNTITTHAEEISRQLIHTFARRLTHLHLELTSFIPNSRRRILAAPTDLDKSPIQLPKLPCLRTLDASLRDMPLTAGILQQAPYLRRLWTAMQMLPRLSSSVEELYLHGVPKKIEIPNQPALRLLSLEHILEDSDDPMVTRFPAVHDSVLFALRQFTNLQHIEEIRLPAAAFLRGIPHNGGIKMIELQDAEFRRLVDALLELSAHILPCRIVVIGHDPQLNIPRIKSSLQDLYQVDFVF